MNLAKIIERQHKDIKTINNELDHEDWNIVTHNHDANFRLSIWKKGISHYDVQPISFEMYNGKLRPSSRGGYSVNAVEVATNVLNKLIKKGVNQ